MKKQLENNALEDVRPKIKSIQALRGIAANLVVIFHVIGAKNAYGYGSTLLDGFAHWGAIGVDIFFIISGFVMALSIEGSNKSPVEFMTDRIVRIIPTYYFITILMFLLYMLMPNGAVDSEDINLQYLAQSLFFISSIFFDKNPIAYVGWTLELELIFYLAIAMSLYIGFLKRLPLLFVTLVALIGLIIDTIIFEFIFGYIIGLKRNAIHVLLSHRVRSLVILALSIFFTLITYEKEIYQIALSLPRFIYWGVPCTILLISTIIFYQFNFWPFVFIGECSYSIYLVQCISIPAWFKIQEVLHLRFDSDITVLGCIIFTNCLGFILFYFIERKFILWWRQFKSGSHGLF